MQVRVILSLFFLCLGGIVLSGCGASLFSPDGEALSGNPAIYKQQLEKNLLRRYNNMPQWSGKVSRVELIVPRPPVRSVDGSRLRVEFDQIVYDIWGNRIPDLEKEYFHVVFGQGNPQIAPVAPGLSIGLDSGGASYSENLPVRSGRVAGPSSAPRLEPLPKSAPRYRDSDVPVAPPAPDMVVPRRIAEAVPVEPKQRLQDNAPELLRSMAAPEAIAGERPRSEVRNLPAPATGGMPALGPELDAHSF